MKVIVGLGNPGKKYVYTRHNAGFIAIDYFLYKLKNYQSKKAFESEIYEVNLEGEKVLLVKPQTYMNLSGDAVGPLMHFYKLKADDLLVIHDEVDLPPMNIRIKTGGGSGGHNGIKSIDASLGELGTEYHRIRIGVGKVNAEAPQMDTADHVLGQFSKEEYQKLETEVLDKVLESAKLIIKNQTLQAMNQFNRREQK